MSWDAPIGYSTHFNFPKYALGANPGADALNENLIEAIDNAIFQNSGNRLLSSNNTWTGVNSFTQTIIGSISGNSGTITIDLDDDSNSDNTFRIIFSSTSIGAGQLKVGGDAFFNPFTGRLLLQNLTVANTISGSISGNAATVTNGLYSNQNYSNPSWLTSLAWSKISSKPTTLSGYGITDAVIWKGELTADPASPGSGVIYYNSVSDLFKIYTEGEGQWLTFLFANRSYSNPSWITSLAESKISFTDITTGNASSSAHGFLPKLENSGTKYLRDDGTWQTPSGSSYTFNSPLSLSGSAVSFLFNTNNNWTGINDFQNTLKSSGQLVYVPESGTIQNLGGGAYYLDTSGKTLIELNPNSNTDLTSLNDEVPDGTIVILTNISSYTITLKSTDNIALPVGYSTLALHTNDMITLRYRSAGGNYYRVISFTNNYDP